MICADCRDLFSALVDGEVGPGTRPALEAHLAGCAGCRAELERFHRTVAALQGLGPTRAPAGFVDRVLSAARPTPWHRRLTTRLFRPLRVMVPLQAVAVLLVAGLALYVYQRNPELQQAARQEAPGLPLPPSRSQDRASAPSQAAPGSAPVTLARERAAGEPDARLAERALEREDAGRGAGSAPTPRAPAPTAPSSATPDGGSSAASSPAVPVAPLASPPAAPAPPPAAAPVPPPAAARAPEPAVSPTPSVGGRTSDADEAAGRREKLGGESVPAPVLPGAMATQRQEKVASQESRVGAAGAGVTARLHVTDMAAADRSLTELLQRVEAAEISRRSEADATVLELAVSGDRWPTLREGLGRLGRLDLDREPGPIPPRFTLRLRISG